MSSACGIIKNAIDELRKQEKRSGYKGQGVQAIPRIRDGDSLKECKSRYCTREILWLWSYSPIFNETAAALFHYPKKPKDG